MKITNYCISIDVKCTTLIGVISKCSEVFAVRYSAQNSSKIFGTSLLQVYIYVLLELVYILKFISAA